MKATAGGWLFRPRETRKNGKATLRGGVEE
jgi:hypothetical protein